MKLLGEVSSEHLADLAELYEMRQYRTLVELLKTRRHNLAQLCLVERDHARISEYQMEAEVIAKIVFSVKEAADKIEKKEKSKK